MQGLFDVHQRNLRPVAHVLEAVSKLRRLVAAAFLLSVFASPAQAGELLGELVLEIDENARVTAQPRPRDGRFVFSVSQQGAGLTYQLVQAAHPLILHWASLPRTRHRRVDRAPPSRRRPGRLPRATNRSTARSAVHRYTPGGGRDAGP